jgi:thymidylate synthase
MFKTAIFIDIDNNTLNPFACQTIQSLVRGGVLVITPSMVDLMNRVEYTHDTIVIIGDVESSLEMGLNVQSNAKYVKDIQDCIKYLSRSYTHQPWWLLCENIMINEMIWSGVIMDVHLSKNYAKQHTNEWMMCRKNIFHQSIAFDRDLLKNVDGMDTAFELVSNARDTFGSLKNRIRHYCRRNHEESFLLSTMNDIITHGFRQNNRTGICSRATFGKQFQYMMAERVDPETGKSSFRLPLLTTKKMFVRGVFAELKWFLSGSTNSKDLESQGVNIWKGNSSREFLDSRGLTEYDEGECGPIYGSQWRDWGGVGIDQVQKCIDSLKNDPFSRRHIISGWNVDDLDKMCLPPCHVIYQFLAHEENGQMYLSLSMYQRSADMFHGVPFNVASMGMFLLMMCHQVGYKPYKLIHSIGDAHIYESHMPAVKKQLQCDPCMFPYVHIESDVKPDIKDYNFENVIIDDYHSHNMIKADMVV